MATNKLGTLVYDLVADTDEFQKGLVEGGRRLTALKKLFLESRTPVESFGIQLQGMRKLIADGAAPINMFSRSIADLALKTKGGGREAREFAQSLRLEARQIIAAASAQKNFSKENLTAASNMIKAANAIDAETDSVRRSAAEKLKNKRALDQETAAAKEAEEQQRRLTKEREKQAAEIEKQRKASARLAEQQRQAAQNIRERLDPRLALSRQMTEARTLGAAGMLSPAEVAAEQKRLLQATKELNPAYREQAERLARVQRGLQNLITPQQRIRTQVRELKQEYRAGNVTYADTVARIRQLRDEHRRLNATQEQTQQRQSSIVAGIRNQTLALARQISAITLFYKAMRQVTEGFRDALEIGRSQRQFETFTGSAEVAAGLMANIREFTAATPVTFGAAQQSVRTLLQYGVAQDEVIDRLKQLGDISGGSTEALQRLALAFGQITANTRLQGQELRQLIEAGFNPLAVISETTGETMMQLRQRMSDGALSAQEVADALQAATSEGGRFANALKNIGEETDFGVIQRLRSEFEKLRADFMIPITAIVGSGASEALENLDKFREEARKRMIFDPDREVLPRDIVPELKMLDHVSGPAALGMKMYQKLIQTIIDEQRRAIKASQAEVDIAMKDIMSSADEQEMSNYEVEDSIHSKITAIRKEAEELRIGADEALIADLRRQGATEDYILALRKEMEELKKLQAEQKRLEEAEKQRHQEAMRRQREREAAAKKAENDRLRRIENERREAEALAKTVMTPLQVLEQEMSDIQRLAEFLTVDERVKLMEQARQRFEKSIEDKESNAMATAALRGSTEEFRMIAEINKSQVDKEQKMHNEAQHERKTTNRKLDLQIKGLDLLPLKLGEELQDLMSTPVK